MRYVDYEELKKAFEALCSMIDDVPCGFEDYAGEFVSDVRSRLYEQDSQDGD